LIKQKNLKKKQKENRTYDQVMKEAESVQHKIIEENVPELCRVLRDEYDGVDHGFTDEYGNPDNDRQSESYKYLRNEYVRLKVMVDLQGVAYHDRVYNKRGVKLLPKKAVYLGEKAVYEKVERKMVPMMKFNRNTMMCDIPTGLMVDNKGKGKLTGWVKKYSKPKEQSEMSKFVEAVIDQEISSWTN